MNDKVRGDSEREIARAVLLLWIFFDSEIKQTGSVNYLAFKTLFDQHVRPTLTQVYGQARNSLANQFGLSYPERSTPTGPVVTLPNLSSTIDTFSTDLYESFQRRQPVNRQSVTVPEDELQEAPTYNEEDAERWSVTNVTSSKARGELDAASDVESRVGKRLVAYWKTEPGACKRCAALEGQPWRVWRLIFPDGPPAHPHCRCDLVWRELLE